MEVDMIVVRNLFRLKFGQAKPAIAAFKEIRSLNTKLGMDAGNRLLTDLVGTSYTLVYELQFESLTAFEQQMQQLMRSDEWRMLYDKFIPHAESGSREIFNIVD
jgi:hypothetical protein